MTRSSSAPWTPWSLASLVFLVPGLGIAFLSDAPIALPLAGVLLVIGAILGCVAYRIWRDHVDALHVRAISVHPGYWTLACGQCHETRQIHDRLMPTIGAQWLDLHATCEPQGQPLSHVLATVPVRATGARATGERWPSIALATRTASVPCATEGER